MSAVSPLYGKHSMPFKEMTRVRNEEVSGRAGCTIGDAFV